MLSKRHKLVHYKTTKRSMLETPTSEELVVEARKALNTVERLIRELANIDPKIDIGWLEKAQG